MGKVARPKTKQLNKRRNMTDRMRMDMVKQRKLGLTLREIAENFGRSYQTVEYTLRKWAPENPDLVKKACVEALLVRSDELGEKAREVLGELTPDLFVHDRVERRDPDTGEVLSVSHTGITAKQVVDVAGKLHEMQGDMIDRAESVQKDLLGEGKSDESADGVAGLMADIARRATELNIKIDLGGAKVEADEANYTEITDGEDATEE